MPIFGYWGCSNPLLSEISFFLSENSLFNSEILQTFWANLFSLQEKVNFSSDPTLKHVFVLQSLSFIGTAPLGLIFEDFVHFLSNFGQSILWIWLEIFQGTQKSQFNFSKFYCSEATVKNVWKSIFSVLWAKNQLEFVKFQSSN